MHNKPGCLDGSKSGESKLDLDNDDYVCKPCVDIKGRLDHDMSCGECNIRLHLIDHFRRFLAFLAASVRRCRLTALTPVLQAPMVSALETIIS